ncbi:hypothetical protein [Paenibacillus luteus]|uniref:hypothetical protein n=1 Tax=Paenibacillus luteus TaxID=2545753 RepID=UPI0019D61ECF|nr:hypothetical protein [Paenibacillus luteus]
MNNDQTEHDQAQVCEAYQTYYQYFTKQEKPNYYPLFVYSIPLSINNKIPVFCAKRKYPFSGSEAMGRRRMALHHAFTSKGRANRRRG